MWLTFVIGQIIAFRWANQRYVKRQANHEGKEDETLVVDRNGRKYLYYW